MSVVLQVMITVLCYLSKLRTVINVGRDNNIFKTLDNTMNLPLPARPYLNLCFTGAFIGRVFQCHENSRLGNRELLKEGWHKHLLFPDALCTEQALWSFVVIQSDVGGACDNPLKTFHCSFGYLIQHLILEAIWVLEEGHSGTSIPCLVFYVQPVPTVQLLLLCHSG